MYEMYFSYPFSVLSCHLTASESNAQSIEWSRHFDHVCSEGEDANPNSLLNRLVLSS